MQFLISHRSSDFALLLLFCVVVKVPYSNISSLIRLPCIHLDRSYGCELWCRERRKRATPKGLTRALRGGNSRIDEFYRDLLIWPELHTKRASIYGLQRKQKIKFVCKCMKRKTLFSYAIMADVDHFSSSSILNWVFA